MRTDWKVTTLTLAILLGACSKRPEQNATLPADLEQDLAKTAAANGELATAPRNFQPMRFVSAVEQSRPGVPAKRPATSHQHAHATSSHTPAPEPAVALAEQTAEIASTSESAAPEPVAAPKAAPQPADMGATIPSMPSSDGTGASGDVGAGSRGEGSGLGGLLGGIIGAVVIRGGHGGIDKCDPRTDGRMHPPIVGRPDFGLPLPTGAPTFPGSRRR